MRVLLTRDRQGNAAWARACHAAGIETYSLETITIRPIISSSAIDVSQFDLLLFTSATAVQVLSQLPIKKTALPEVAVVGEATANAAKKAGMTVSFISPSPTAHTLARALPIKEHQKILWLHSALADLGSLRILRSRGGEVAAVPIYTTHILTEPDPRLAPLLATGQIDKIVVASPSAVRGLLARAPRLSTNIPVVAIGSKTANVARQAGFARMQIAQHPNIGGILDAIL